ncbi:MAG: DotU family type IV/VI secretion system protein [Succinivibrio sp.]
MAISALHELIRPVLLCVSDYYLYKKHGVEEQKSNVVTRLQSLFSEIHRKVEADDFLRRDYQLIEKPLVFFVDYFIKESGFSFSRDYEPMARMYNELSGDDKFFDILDSYLKNENTSKDVIETFYLMLGLGFDGAFKREPKDVIPYIHNCRDRIDCAVDFKTDYITPLVQPNDNEIKESGKNEVRSFLLKKNFLFILVAVTVLSLVINLASVHKNVNKFNEILEQTVDAASPYLNMSAEIEAREDLGKSKADAE